MSRNYDHDRLSPAELSAGLDAANLTVNEFERLTGANRQSMVDWLRPVGHPRHKPAPFWVSSWLGLYLLPDGPDRAEAVAAEKLIPLESTDAA